MADYLPLLTKTFNGLSDTGPAMRSAVYERARQALSGQLRQLLPPLSPAEIDKEGAALERAIDKIEATYAERDAEMAAAPAPVAAPTAPAVHTPPPATPAPAAEASAVEAGGPVPEPALRAERTAAAAVAIRKGGRRSSLFWPLGFLALAVPVGVVAWLYRDRPAPAVPEPVVATAPVPATAPPSDTKYGERVGGGAARSPATAPTAPAAPPAAPPAGPGAIVPAARPAPAPTASDRAPAPDAATTVAVAQRAMLFEEAAGGGEPKLTTGRVVWRLDATNPGQGLPLETVVQGRVEVSALGMAMTMTVRRNVDPALPASHTIELTFATPSGDPSRVVRDVGLPLMRPEETIRGVAVAGLPVPVKENVFLIGLSDLKSDVDRNTELLLNRPWMELPLRFASGQKAVLLFEKGLSGDRVMSDAFKQWAATP